MKRLVTIILSLLLYTVNASARDDHDGNPSRITHTWQDAPLLEVLRDINEESRDYHIHCIYDQLDSVRISVKVTNMTIPDAVAKITKGKPVKVKVKKHDIFIQYKKSMARRKMTISGYVKDSRSHVALVDATVQLLTADSILIAQKKAGSHFTSQDRSYTSNGFSFEIPKMAANYILRISHVGYQTASVNVSLSKIGRWEFQRSLPPVYLKEERYMLKEVSVVASKVMFYYRGDTLVYNADAFQLAEGSMLDALVKQLPGVELREGGLIYHNGKFVQNLLLNGKDFFRGNQELMLDNLPSYIVKEIKVYDRHNPYSRTHAGGLDDGKEYVMDVRLKREYSIGWLVNAEGGAGSSDRYLARLFALRLSDHSKLAVIGNVNNLNDEKTPGEMESWKPAISMALGRPTHKMAGIDYLIEDRDQIWILSGNTQLKYDDLDLQKRTERTNYLTSGDTYDHIVNSNRNHAVDVDVHNSLWINNKQKEKVGGVLWHDLQYSRINLQTASSSMTFSSSDSLLNQQIRQGMTKGHNLYSYLHGSLYKKHRFGETNLGLSYSYNDKNDDRFDRYRIRYGTSVPDANGNHYTQGHPDRKTIVNTSLFNSFTIGSHSLLGLRYDFDYVSEQKKSALYLLDRIDSLQQLPFGTLPSTLDYEQAMDAGNSYDSRTHSQKHKIDPYLSYNKKWEKGGIELYVSVPVIYQNRHLDYHRGTMDTTIVCKSLFVDNIIAYAQWTDNNRNRTCRLYYSLNTILPNLTDLVDIHDDTDPMNLQEGNNRLANAYKHKLTASYNYNNNEKQTSYYLKLTYQNTQNALSKGYSYDAATGVRTWKSYNVNGNWNTALTGQIDVPLDKARRLSFRSYTSLQYYQSVDMIDERRSQVKTLSARQLFRLNWKIGSHSLGLRLEGTLRRSQSPRADFEDFTSVYLDNSVSALLKLPWKVELSTDVSALTRGGYKYTDMNGTEFVWNARLTRPFLKGRLLLVLDGYDLLAQRSAITRIVNAQGRTESYTNTLPSYVLLHAVWRLNKKPKKTISIERK